MKKRNILQSFICLLAVSCTVQELDVVTPQISDGHEVFHASFESSEPDTRVSLDEHVKILWDVDDRISIFNKSTLNQQYRFRENEPANSGDFDWVPDDYFGAGNDLDYICAVYPYLASTKISNSDVLTLTLPEEQAYKENSFGPGANTMVSVTDGGSLLRFKNVGGFLALKFYGEGVSVSSIRLVGNNGERLSGEATLELPFGTTPEDPKIEMASTAGKTILLDCDENGVELGDSDNPTIFWMVVPPTCFSKGFTLLVSDTNGDVFIKETDKELTIKRNSIVRIAPIQVDFDSAGLSIDEVESADPDKLPSKTAYDGRTITVTTPTLNRSNLVLSYTFTGESLKANGLDVVNGETAVDVTKPVTLTVRSGNYGKNYTLVGCNTGLPVVRITTDGFTLADLEGYENALQSSDELDHRIWLGDGTNTNVSIEYADGSPGLKIDKKPAYSIKTQIKGRGNYTWIWDKKPYAFKFADKAEVLGMPAHKRWILLANWRDRTLLRNDATFWLSRKSGLPYTVRGEFVELEINGEYRGNYYLCEQIKIDKNRVNIKAFDDDLTDLTGGYLMEIDSYWDEINKFHSAEFSLNYMFKEPDEDTSLEGTNPAYALGYKWMEKHIAEFERVLKTRSSVANGDYNNYLDIDSAIMFMILNELSGNRDFYQGPPHNGPHSTYLYKDKGGKLFMGPGWDFDYETYISLDYIKQNSNNRDGWRGFTRTGYYYHYLRYNADFVARIKTLWNSKMTAFQGLPDYIDDMVVKIGLSQKFDEARWPYNTSQDNRNDNHDYYENGNVVPFQTAIKRMKDNFDERVDWMNTKINALTTTSPTFKYKNPSEWPTEE